MMLLLYIKKAMEKINKINERTDGEAKFNFPFSRNDFDFSSYTNLNSFGLDIQNYRISLDDAIKKE